VNVCVLGRGQSINRISEIDKPDIFLLVNSFDPVWKIVKPYTHRSRAIVCRLGTGLSTKKTYNKLNVDYVVHNFLKDEYNSKKMKPLVDRLRNMGIKSVPMPKVMRKDSLDGKGGYPTTGMLAVSYAISVLNAKTISLAGVDFYCAPYSKEVGRVVKDYQVTKGKRMKKFFVSLVKKYLHIQFNLYTAANVDWKYPNLRIIQ